MHMAWPLIGGAGPLNFKGLKMNRDTAYTQGMQETLLRFGMDKQASSEVTDKVLKLRKQASLFNFSDNPYGGGIKLHDILVPLLAAGLTGYVAYNAGQQGSRHRSAMSNIMDYIGRTGNKFIRKNDPKPTFDYKHMLENWG